MATHVVAPVKNILKSLEVGIKLAKRTARAADLASRDQALQIFESARSLQSSLERTSRAICDAYEQSAEVCGEPFARALLENRSIQAQFKELRLDLIDQLDRCQDFDEEPDSFEPNAFTSLDQEAQRCRDGCLGMFSELRDQYFHNLQYQQPGFNTVEDVHRQQNMKQETYGHSRGHFPFTPDDIAHSRAGAKSANYIGNSRVELESPVTPNLYIAPLMLKNTWAVSNSSYGVSPMHQIPPTQLSRTTFPIADAKPLPLIPREIEQSPTNSDDWFWEKTQQVQILPQDETKELSSFSPTSIYSKGSMFSPATPSTMYTLIESRLSDEHRISDAFSDDSIPGYSLTSSRAHSRLSRSSSSGYDSLATSQLSQVQSPESTQSPTTRSIQLDRFIHSQDNHASISHKSLPSSPPPNGWISDNIDRWATPTEPPPYKRQSYDPVASSVDFPRTGPFEDNDRKIEVISGRMPKAMPPLHEINTRENWPSSEHMKPPETPQDARRTSENIEHWGPPATRTRSLGLGAEIESGLEVVVDIDRDNEKMVVSQEEDMPAFVLPTSTASTKLMDCPITQDASFYRFGGFCDGAQLMIRGETGFKVVKRPSGHYSATVSARCVKCSYEVGWNDVEKDRLISRDGIYGNSGIRWRQKFISKCHIKTGSIEEPMYACIFCIEEHQTVEDHDATVFFSVSQLFRHLAKHPRPLPNVQGITTIYGKQSPDVVDFDIHFTMADPLFPKFSMSEITTQVTSRAMGQATGTHNPKPTGRNARDPDGQYSLHFAVGARIVGVTFPDRFAGQWCVGYHDGERGSFPTEKITLQMPAKEDVLMNARSSLTAIAKWDFKPKDAKDGGWLKFSKGDRLVCIGYTYVDQWCWSGQTSKGKWGLFPSSFVKDLKDMALMPDSRPTTARSSSSKSGFGTIMGMGRNKSKHERNGSVRSVSSTGSGNMMQPMPVVNTVRSQAEQWASL